MACARLGPAQAVTTLEPHFRAPPAPGDNAFVAELEARLTALSGEIANLSKALDLLGPLPDHPDLFIPVDPSDLDAPAARPGNPVSDIFNTGLGAYSGLRAEARGLGQFKSGYKAPSHNIRLGTDAGEDEAIAALCVELSAVAGQPRVPAPIRAW